MVDFSTTTCPGDGKAHDQPNPRPGTILAAGDNFQIAEVHAPAFRAVPARQPPMPNKAREKT